MWTRFDVTWEFLTPLCASMPADPNLIKAWLDARKPRVRPPTSRSIDELAEEAISTLEEPAKEPESMLLVFQRRDGHFVVRMDTIRAHLKDCAQVLSSLYTTRVRGERSFAVKVKNALYWDPAWYWVSVRRKGQDEAVTAPNGIIERPVHSMTPQGQISALKAFEYVDDALLQFPLFILTSPSGPIIKESDLKTLMQYGGLHGYAGERSREGGRYVFTIQQGTEDE